MADFDTAARIICPAYGAAKAIQESGIAHKAGEVAVESAKLVVPVARGAAAATTGASNNAIGAVAAAAISAGTGAATAAKRSAPATQPSEPKK